MVAAPGLASQALRFGIVGVLNTAVTFAIIALLREFASVPLWLASGIGYGVGTVQSYLLNRNWTFGSTGDRALPAAQFSRFVGVNIVLALLFSALNEILARQFALLASTLLATAIVVPLSFLMMRFFVFGRRRA